MPRYARRYGGERERPQQLRALGARVGHALCVIDRQEGGERALAAEGINLRALLTRADLDGVAAG